MQNKYVLFNYQSLEHTNGNFENNLVNVAEYSRFSQSQKYGETIPEIWRNNLRNEFVFSRRLILDDFQEMWIDFWEWNPRMENCNI